MEIFIVFLVILMITLDLKYTFLRHSNCKTILRELSAKLGGNFIDGGFTTLPKVEIKHREWTLTFCINRGSEYFPPDTTIKVPFVSKDGFNFRIRRRRKSRFFRKEHTGIRIPQFCDDFIIKGNDEKKIKQLLGNSKIRESISRQYDFHLFISEERSEHRPYLVTNSVLHFMKDGEILGVAQLEELFYLFAEILDQLCSIGSI